MEYKAPSRASYGEGIRQTFEYAIVPFAPVDSATDVLLVHEGLSFNRPLLAYVAGGDAGRNETSSGPWGYAGDENAIIFSIRRDGMGTILRIYESVGRPARGRIRVPHGVKRYAGADGLGNPKEPLQACKDTVPVELRAFEIVTLVFE